MSAVGISSLEEIHVLLHCTLACTLGEATNSFISSCMICMTFDIRTVKDESLLSVMSHKQHAF